MSLPHVDQKVTLVIPSREKVPARVRDAGPGWVDVELDRAIAQHPHGHPVFLHFISAEGIERLLCEVPRGADCGRGATVRVAHRGRPQLLKRSDLVQSKADKRLVAWPSQADSAAREGRAVALSGAGLVVRGLPLAPGQLHQFELELDRDQPVVAGQFRVERRLDTGDADVRFTIVSPRDRARVVAACLES